MSRQIRSFSRCVAAGMVSAVHSAAASSLAPTAAVHSVATVSVVVLARLKLRSVLVKRQSNSRRKASDALFREVHCASAPVRATVEDARDHIRFSCTQAGFITVTSKRDCQGLCARKEWLGFGEDGRHSGSVRNCGSIDRTIIRIIPIYKRSLPTRPSCKGRRWAQPAKPGARRR